MTAQELINAIKGLEGQIRSSSGQGFQSAQIINQENARFQNYITNYKNQLQTQYNINYDSFVNQKNFNPGNSDIITASRDGTAQATSTISPLILVGGLALVLILLIK